MQGRATFPGTFPCREGGELAAAVAKNRGGTNSLVIRAEISYGNQHQPKRMKPRILPVILLSLFSAGALEAAPVVDKWQWRNPLPQGHDLKALAYGNGLYVAVGDYGTILSSADGVEWGLHSLETLVSINGVVYGNGTFVAVGHRQPTPPTFTFGVDVVLTSGDGTNWTERATGVNGQANFLWNVAYGNGLFVAVGSTSPYLWPYNDFVLTSPDGVSWTSRTAGTNSGITRISFGDGRFVAVGNSDIIQTSVNGIDWDWKPFATGGTIQNVAYGAGSWFAVGYVWGAFGYTAFISSSPDALNWTVRHVGANVGSSYSPLLAVAYGNGRFTAMGMEFINSEANLTLFSADGLTWERAPDLHMLQRPTALLHAAGQFVAVGEYGNIATSPDGRAWTGRSRATSNNLRGIAYGDGTFVAVGNNGTNLTSPNGMFWVGHKTGTGGNLREVTFAASQFVAVGSDGTIVNSPNGADWFAQDSGTTEDLWDVTYGNGTFVSVGGNSGGNDDRVYRFAILTSSDGANWATRLADPNFTTASFELHGVAYGNGRFVAVGRPAAILTSFNGVNWVTNRNVPEFFTYLKGIAYGNGLFVTVGETTNAWTSPDGNTWTLRPLPVPQFTQLDDVGYGDGAFVAVGDGGIILTSVNGIDWSVPHSRTSTNLRDVTYGAGTFVIVGNNDHILQSGTNATPPAFQIVGQPRNQLVLPGASVTFDVLVQASTPLTYQWRRNGTDIPGANGPSLAFSNVQVDDSAYFSVNVNNGAQSLTSSPAFLLVMPNDPLDSWTLLRGTVPSFLLGVTYGNGRFVAVGNTTALTSSDGVAWATNAVAGTNLQDVAFGNGLFVACGAGIAISDDGINWTPRPSGTPLQMNAVTYGNGRFVAVGGFGGNTTSSPDGVTWAFAPLFTNSMLRDVTYGNGQFVAVGESGHVFTSPNGMNWTFRNSGTNAPLYGVAYGNGQFVAVSPLPLILTSPDGVAWTTRTNVGPFGFVPFAVTYGHGQFVVLGSDGTTLSSVGGVNWTIHPPVWPALSLRNLAAGPSNFVAVGSQIIQSSLLVPAPPYVVVPPRSKAPLIGSSYTLNVSAAGTPPPRYQWRLNDAELPGATSSNYIIASVQLTNEGTYTVDLGNPFGSTTSAPAEVIAGVSATILQHPLSQDVAVGGSVTMSAVVTGRPPAFTYIWRYESTLLRVTNTSSEPMTFHTYVAPSIIATQRFRVVVSNAASIGLGDVSDYATVRVLADTDGDSLPDEWESAFGFGPTSAGDGTNDFDLDGLSNAAEFIAGTNPTNAASGLRLEVAQTAGSSARLRFTAVANKTYTVLVKPALDTSPWQRLADVAATANDRTVEIQDSFGVGNANRFYRLVTPRSP